MYGAQGPFIPMPQMTKPQAPQQSAVYKRPDEPQGDEWYEILFKALPFVGSAYELGEDVFGSDSKKKKKGGSAAEGVASIGETALNVAGMFGLT